MFEVIIFLVFCVIALALAVFAWGPAVLEWFFNTLEEWEDVINSARNEK